MPNIISKSDILWIARYLAFERVTSNYLENVTPLEQNFGDFYNIDYLLSKTEMENITLCRWQEFLRILGFHENTAKCSSKSYTSQVATCIFALILMT